LPQKLSEHLVSIFNGQVKLPEYYWQGHGAAHQIRRGHPIENHPISDVMDPSNLNKVRNR
jgi:hypothetical protein